MTIPALLLAVGASLLTGDPQRFDSIEVEGALVTLIEEVEVSAREAGVLAAVVVTEGELVEEDKLLANIDDAEAQIALARAQLELDNARREAKNDVKVRLAQKILKVAQVELKRADEARERFSKSISQSELDERRLKTEKGVLDVEQAQHEFETAQHLARVGENELALAQRALERRKIESTLDGMVVKVYKQRGEWVEPGESVMRIVRMDRLRVEGFVDARLIVGEMTGRPVTLSVKLSSERDAEFPGKLVFVSPEIDPLNGQVRVWAEVENRSFLLRPGLKGSMRIGASSNAAHQ